MPRPELDGELIQPSEVPPQLEQGHQRWHFLRRPMHSLAWMVGAGVGGWIGYLLSKDQENASAMIVLGACVGITILASATYLITDRIWGVEDKNKWIRLLIR